MANHLERAVVVLAAGAGTRMKSERQKTLHEIGGRSMLAHSLHAAAGVCLLYTSPSPRDS